MDGIVSRGGLAQGRGTMEVFIDRKPYGRYDGELHDGKLHGRGVYTFAGVRYDGEWRDDKPNGFGTYTNIDAGKTLSGISTNGCFRDGRYWATVATTEEECGVR